MKPETVSTRRCECVSAKCNGESKLSFICLCVSAVTVKPVPSFCRLSLVPRAYTPAWLNKVTKILCFSTSASDSRFAFNCASDSTSGKGFKPHVLLSWNGWNIIQEVRSLLADQYWIYERVFVPKAEQLNSDGVSLINRLTHTNPKWWVLMILNKYLTN